MVDRKTEWFGYPVLTRAKRLMGLLFLTLLILAGTGFALPGQATAAETSTATTATAQENKQAAGKWKEKKKYFYYYKNGKPLKGLQVIDGKTYLFDKAGKQLTGWRQTGKVYRYFRIENGAKGCMVKGRKVNRIMIDKDGKAKVKSDVKARITLLVRYQKLVDRLVRPGMNKKDKLIRVFKVARDKPYAVLPRWGYSGRWEEKLGAAFLDKSYVDCTAQAGGFAFLANAVGYKKVAVRLYGHAHCEINGRIYDPGFAKIVPDKEYVRYFNKTHKQLKRMGIARTNPLHFL